MAFRRRTRSGRSTKRRGSSRYGRVNRYSSGRVRRRSAYPRRRSYSGGRSNLLRIVLEQPPAAFGRPPIATPDGPVQPSAPTNLRARF